MHGTIAYITPVRAFSRGGELYMQSASGRVAEAMAQHCETLYLCARVVPAPPAQPFDPPLRAKNIEIIEQPWWDTTAGSLRHPFRFAQAYSSACRLAGVVFIRGMCPYTGILYACALAYRKPVCHWIVGDPVALLREAPRKGGAADRLALLYALLDRRLTRWGRSITGGALLCNGEELARACASPRTFPVVSSTVRERDFFVREDTCQGPRVRILFVGFVRPEKGIEYFFEALARLRADLQWELEIVGPREFPRYALKLERLAASLGIERQVRWSGYVPNGEPLFSRMRSADLLVLPSLSEGTPHVLVEARANSLPCISTTVGGVPSTVTDGRDALLVPPKDAPALARAIERVIADGELRRRLIRNGLGEVRKQTLDRFIATALRELHAESAEAHQPVPQE